MSMTSLSEKHLQLYNFWLRAVRGCRNQPWRPKVGLDNFSSEDTLALLKLESFFNRHSYIDPEDFFRAPFKVSTQEGFLPLTFFTTPKAQSTYKTYARLYLDFPTIPTKEHLKTITFIASYCKQMNLTLDEYFGEKSDSRHIPLFLQHIKYRKFHPIFALYSSIASDILNNKDSNQLLQFYLGERRWESLMKIQKLLNTDDQLHQVVSALMGAVEKQVLLSKQLKTTKQNTTES